MTSLRILRIRKEEPLETRFNDPVVRTRMACCRNHFNKTARRTDDGLFDALRKVITEYQSNSLDDPEIVLKPAVATPKCSLENDEKRLFQ